MTFAEARTGWHLTVQCYDHEPGSQKVTVHLSWPSPPPSTYNVSVSRVDTISYHLAYLSTTIHDHSDNVFSGRKLNTVQNYVQIELDIDKAYDTLVS